MCLCIHLEACKNTTGYTINLISASVYAAYYIYKYIYIYIYIYLCVYVYHYVLLLLLPLSYIAEYGIPQILEMCKGLLEGAAHSPRIVRAYFRAYFCAPGIHLDVLGIFPDRLLTCGPAVHRMRIL